MIHRRIAGSVRLPLRGRIVFLWLVFLHASIQSQQLFFDQFSVSEGLAQSTVFKVIQDSRDIFWLGTQAGVSRFDGLEFINYTAGHLWFTSDGSGVVELKNPGAEPGQLDFTQYSGRVLPVFCHHFHPGGSQGKCMVRQT